MPSFTHFLFFVFSFIPFCNRWATLCATGQAVPRYLWRWISWGPVPVPGEPSLVIVVCLVTSVIFLSPILIHGIELRPVSLREITPRSIESAPPFSCIQMLAVLRVCSSEASGRFYEWLADTNAYSTHPYNIYIQYIYSSLFVLQRSFRNATLQISHSSLRTMVKRILKVKPKKHQTNKFSVLPAFLPLREKQELRARKIPLWIDLILRPGTEEMAAYL